MHTLFVVRRRLYLYGIHKGMRSPFRECPLMVEHLLFRLEVLRNGKLPDLSLVYLISNLDLLVMSIASKPA